MRAWRVCSCISECEIRLNSGRRAVEGGSCKCSATLALLRGMWDRACVCVRESGCVCVCVCVCVSLLGVECGRDCGSWLSGI